MDSGEADRNELVESAGDKSMRMSILRLASILPSGAGAWGYTYLSPTDVRLLSNMA